PMSCKSLFPYTTLFRSACCPPNIARLLSSLAGYAFEENEHELYVNLYTGGVLNTRKNGRENQITFETDYPWNGQVKITIENQEEDRKSTRLNSSHVSIS